MIFTNKHNLPDEVAKVLSKDRYDGGSEHSDYSVTTLKTPPRIVQLQRRHKEELSEDVIDCLWSMFGSMAHSLLEEHGSSDAVTEKRFYLTILDRIISGQVDHYKDKVITDYKVTSAWTLVYGTRVKEWEEQLNMYAYLCTKSGLPVERIRIVTILRDWDKNKALQNQDYPQTPIKIIPITLWTHDEQEEYIEERVLSQKLAESKSDSDLPCCETADMWERPSTFAVMKEGRKSAVRVFDTEEEAFNYHDATCTPVNPETGLVCSCREKYTLQVRPGKRTRCEEYCNVSSFCSQYQEYLKSKEPNE
jgi:hypothetical protein